MSIQNTDGTPGEADGGSPSTDRASLLAGLDALTDDEPGEGAAEPAEEAEEPAADEEPTEDETEEEPEADDDAEEPDADADDEPADEEPAADEPDAVAAKRIAQINDEEKRAKRAIADEREQLKAERAQHAEQVKAVEEFDRLKARASYDPVTVMEKLIGRALTAAEHEATAKQHFLLSKAGDDPKYKEKAAELARMRGNSTELENANERIAKLEARLEADVTQREQARELEDYTGKIVSAVNGKTPIVSTMLKANPARAKERLLMVARDLSKNGTVIPEPAEVLAELEKVRRAELEELGIDPKTIGAKIVTKTKTPTAAKNKKAPTKKISNKQQDEVTDPQARRDALFEGWPTE